ncbi:hypothetical protein LRAMOSA01447 [Lichtheimia ramosa]|uniref:Conserved oligomeric Golgi complex subunit 5 n=1 Tax=Lichtheimia ramosa TaxID=688394 RepID=A0A077WK82_9FUNG|nr:hypothetical protein LRAMOSA01447 [Lichtheimia ramosa]
MAHFGLQEADSYIDYDKFLSDSFDANGYADAIISTSGTGDKAEVAAALSNLSFSIASLDKQIQNEVAANYDTLLGQVRGIRELEIVLSTVQTNIIELKRSLARLATKIRDPYNQLQSYNIQLENLQYTSDLLRRLHRFIVLVRRLETQLGTTSSDRDMSAAALTLYELETIMQDPDLDGIDIITSSQSFIQSSKTSVEEEAGRLLNDGLTTRNQTRMAAGLQILYNMKQMEQKVDELLQSISDELAREIRRAVDMSSLQREMRGTSSGPAVRRVNHEPTFASQSQWTQAIWNRMESLTKTMKDGCINVYSLEKVLELKRDSITQTTYLETTLKTLDATSLVSRFWRQLSATFEKELREATKASTFLRSTFVSEYPKLQRLVQDFLSQIALHNGVSMNDFSQSPEYIIMLRSISVFESGYRAKSKRESTF